MVSVWVWVLGELAFRVRNRGGVGRFEWTLAAVAVSLGLGVGVGFLAASHHAAPLPGGWAPVIVGELLFVAGLALRFWAIFTLGRFFKVTISIQQCHRVIRSGPYRVLRHPSYSGLLLILLGLGLMLGTWPGLAALIVVPLIGMLIRIRVEESVLKRALGAEYTSYAAETRRQLVGIFLAVLPLFKGRVPADPPPRRQGIDLGGTRLRNSAVLDDAQWIEHARCRDLHKPTPFRWVGCRLPGDRDASNTMARSTIGEGLEKTPANRSTFRLYSQ